jgi:hypothetical protein
VLLRRRVLAIKNLLSALVDDLALLVHHLVVLQDIFSNFKVSTFNRLLRTLNGLSRRSSLPEERLQGNALVHHPAHRVVRKQPHEVVFEMIDKIEFHRGHPVDRLDLGAGCRFAETRDARYQAHTARRNSLTSITFCRAFVRNLLLYDSTSASANFVFFDCFATRSKFLSSQTFGVTTEKNVDTTTSHVGSNSHGSNATSLGNDGSFFCVFLRVQNAVLDARFGEHARESFRFFNRDGTDQYRLALLVTFDEISHNSVVLPCFALVDIVRIVGTLPCVGVWESNTLRARTYA